MSQMTQDEYRLLVALYRLTGGVPGLRARREDLQSEVDRVGLFVMTPEAFDGYRAGTIFRAREQRQ